MKTLLTLLTLLLVGCATHTPRAQWQEFEHANQWEAQKAALKMADLVGGSILYFDARSGSMRKIIERNGFLVYTRVQLDDSPLGSVIIFDNGQSIYTVHRIVKNGGYYVLTKGDNNKYIDNTKTTQDNLIGRVIPIIHTWEK